MSPFGPIAERLRLRIQQAQEAVGGLPADPPATVRHAAVALALQPGDAGIQLLLMRRAEQEGDPWSGQVSLPGGHAEDFDADLAATAVRETREEVTVDLDSSGELLGALEPIQALVGGRVLDMWIHPFVFGVHEPVEPVPGPEASEAFWFPLRRALSGELDTEHRFETNGITRVLPAWTFEERTIWGLTHRIVSRLLDYTGSV